MSRACSSSSLPAVVFGTSSFHVLDHISHSAHRTERIESTDAYDFIIVHHPRNRHHERPNENYYYYISSRIGNKSKLITGHCFLARKRKRPSSENTELISIIDVKHSSHTPHDVHVTHAGAHSSAAPIKMTSQ